jgi:hypothetical protein
VTETTEDKAVKDNFGGSYRYANGSSSTSTKRYSAYMLFYVRVDAIQKVFQECSIELIPPNVREYSETDPGGEVESETANTIKFVTEDGLKKNTQNGIRGIRRGDTVQAIPITRETTVEQLYEKVADHLSIGQEELRLWELVGDYALAAILPDSPADNQRLARIKPYDQFFAQLKPAEEPLALRSTDALVFVKWYTGDAEFPMVYLGAFVIPMMRGWTELSKRIKREL